MNQIPLPKLSGPAAGAFAVANIKSLNDVTKFTEKEIANLHGVGPATIKPLKALLAKHGLSFRK